MGLNTSEDSLLQNNGSKLSHLFFDVKKYIRKIFRLIRLISHFKENISSHFAL